jgi:phosphotriesterase-related protein
MVKVNTVLGPVDSSNLGFTLMHEHLIFSFSPFFRTFPELFGENPMERLVTHFKQAKQGGVDTIVDATTFAIERDVELMAEVSRRSGVNIIACTGCSRSVSNLLQNVSIDEMADLLAREVDKGIAGTNIKTGIFKSASDVEGVTREVEPMLRATARAHLKTGAPIMLHSYAPGKVGTQQVDILEDEGVDLKWVKVDHSNETTDLDYLKSLMDRGSYLGMDRYAAQNMASSTRNQILKALIDAGYANRLCPSHDWAVLAVRSAPGPNNKTLGEYIDGMEPYGYLYLKKVVFPQLREMGVDESTLSRLFVTNPQKFFEGA